MTRVGALLTLLLAAMGSAGDAVPQSPAHERRTPSEILETLVGSWRFELFPTGESAPRLSGTRSFRRFIDDHPMLVWVESFDGRDAVVAGVLGYDETLSRFYELGSPSRGPVDHWLGTQSPDSLAIDWVDSSDEEDPSRGTLRIVSLHAFEYRTEAYVAVFTRAPLGEPEHPPSPCSRVETP